MSNMPSCDSPTLVCEHQPQLPVIDGHGVGVTVVNFNTSAYTAHCIASLAMAHTPPARILVLDNGSSAEAFDALIRSVEALPRTHLLIYRSEQNLGFACGSNFLVDRLREWDGCCYVGLLNNDAQAEPIWTDALVAALQANPGLHGMAGGRMHKLRNTSEVDTLGISIYGSLMPADRLRTDDLYMGPTGGCCLMTRACVEDIIAETGYFFDPRFFLLLRRHRPSTPGEFAWLPACLRGRAGRGACRASQQQRPQSRLHCVSRMAQRHVVACEADSYHHFPQARALVAARTCYVAWALCCHWAVRLRLARISRRLSLGPCGS